jgi:uncharacterized tellurite resistance protein B-like protein
MLRSLRDLFESLAPRVEAEPMQAREHRLQLAAAVLLVEVMRSDSHTNEAEQAAVLRALRQRFALGEDELARLVELAEGVARDAHDLFSFTSKLNDSLDHAQKVQIVENLWQVAYADAQLSADENHLIRKIADLLHVPHGAYISAKLRAKAAAQRP